MGRSARCCRRASSPALVDVDAVDFVGTDGNLGQRLDHVVALQNHVPLRADQETMKSSQSGPRVHAKTGRCFHLLFVVVTGHVQHKQAVAQRAD